MTPVRCFVTFEYTEGLNLFMQMIIPHENPLKNETQFGIEAEDAPIPSNIIWQERNRTRKEVICKKLYSFILICVILFIFMIAILFIRSWAA